MKNLKAPESSGGRAGDIASGAFAKAARSKAKRSPARSKQAKGKQVDAVTKTIKKTTRKARAPNVKAKVNAALKSQGPAKARKVVKVKTATPKKATKEKARKGDVKSAKSTKKPAKATNGTGEKAAKGKKQPLTGKSAKKPRIPVTSPMKLVVPLKTSPQKTVKTPSKAVKTSAKTPKSSKTSPKVTRTSPPTRSANPAKINPKSVAIKKKKKPTLKNKIKIAGLIGKKVARSDENGVGDVATKQAPKKYTRAKKKTVANVPLRVRMMGKLQAARFRYLNEELYTHDSRAAAKLFAEDPAAFAAYHDGYRRQVKAWPANPLTKIIAAVKGMSEKLVVADFGCGDAELAQSVRQSVHSFDLVAANERVTACDMAKVPLDRHSVDVAVFCLSLMGTNLQDFLLEANRVLKVGGLLLIAEVASRFDKVDNFVAGLDRYGFANVHKDFEHNFFYIMHFRKERDVKNKKKLPTIGLLPCVYKRR